MKQEWLDRPEGGGYAALRFICDMALFCGRNVTRLVLYPVTLYFLVRRGPERRASRAYLTRVLGRRATLWDCVKHIYTFASVTLDRVFWLTGQSERFAIQRFGLEELRRGMNLERGVLVFGSHLGSFDALRSLSLGRTDVNFRAVIDIDHSPALSAILGRLNPKLASAIINPRQEGLNTALAIKEALDKKSLVTMLVERARPENATVTAEFLGEPAPFPTAPWQLAAALKVPIVLCFGVYRGGNRYDLHFEPFTDSLHVDRGNRQQALQAAIQRFADRLSHYARLAPYNWFNFYDFWHIDPASLATNRSTAAAVDARERES